LYPLSAELSLKKLFKPSNISQFSSGAAFRKVNAIQESESRQVALQELKSVTFFRETGGSLFMMRVFRFSSMSATAVDAFGNCKGDLTAIVDCGSMTEVATLVFK
jgi:hypothetical protein